MGTPLTVLCMIDGGDESFLCGLKKKKKKNEKKRKKICCVSLAVVRSALSVAPSHTVTAVTQLWASCGGPHTRALKV